MTAFDPQGVIPAILLPFDDNYDIDEEAYRAHLRDVLDVDGISAITVNAHSTEVGSCSRAEQQRVLAIALEEAGDLPVVSGVFTDSTREAQRIAHEAEREGAAALLVFPPALFSIGAQVKPQMMIDHHRAIAEATDLPLIFFQFQESEGLGFSLEAMWELCEQVPTIRATKDFSNNPAKLEATVRLLQGRDQPVHVLTTHSAWLLPSLISGCDGILSGSGSVIADLHVALFEAVRNDDLRRAREIHELIYPTSSAFYSAPFVDMHNRMKHALKVIGRLPNDLVRRPLLPLSAEEQSQIQRAVVDAGLTAPK